MPVLTRNQKRKMQNAQQPPPKRLRTYLPEVKTVLQSRNRVPPPLPKRPPLPPRTRPPLPSRPPKAALKATEPRPTSSDMKIRYRKDNTKNKTKEVLFDVMDDFKSLGFESRFVSIPIDEMHSFDDALEVMETYTESVINHYQLQDNHDYMQVQLKIHQVKDEDDGKDWYHANHMILGPNYSSGNITPDGGVLIPQHAPDSVVVDRVDFTLMWIKRPSALVVAQGFSTL